MPTTDDGRMKMSGRSVNCCVALFLLFASVSAVKRLNSINDLKKINFGQTVPRHSLLLLHWFANTIDIDNNDVIFLTFDPNDGDYGSHHYGNFERLLNPLPQGNVRYRYYTVGNRNRDTLHQLPNYVINPPREYVEGNRDRIIFRVREQNTRWHSGYRIDQVYITQHYRDSSDTRYDADHTYQVTTNLLRQIREFSVGENETNSLTELRDDFGSNINDSQLRQIKITWRELACLGLLLFMVIQEKHSSNQRQTKSQDVQRRNINPDVVINIPETRQSHRGVQENIQLTVTTGTNGKARILWSNVPRFRLQEGVMVALFKNDKDQQVCDYRSIGDNHSGCYDTSVLLNAGLQARLHKSRTLCCFWKTLAEEICRGEEFENPGKVKITGYDASLQLFVRDGKACARLFVSKSFTQWRSEFKNSWVGFYTSAGKNTNEYKWWQWQWATKFNKSTYYDFLHDIYEFHSGMTIAPGAQARFILRDYVATAQTPGWR